MRSATVAIEDKRYWQHGALDWHGIARAALNNLQAGGIRQGGSTISQQLAKNLYLQREAGSRSLSRKIDEAWIAVQLQNKYTQGRDPHGLPQHRLLRRERLRRRGRGAHVLRQDREAADAAAVGAAGRPAAGAERLQPVRPPGCRARSAAPRCSARCASCAGSAPTPTRSALNAPLEPQARQLRHGRRPRRSCSIRCARSSTPGCRPSSRSAAACGSTRRSTSACSSPARRAIKDVLKSPGDPSAALVAINVHNGNVLALGTSDYGSAANQFNLATAGHRSPGSTFKLFALVDALRRGADPEQGLLPVGLRLVPRERPGLPAGRRLVAPQRRWRRRRLHEPRDGHDPLGQRRLRPAHARPRARRRWRRPRTCSGSARSSRCTARWCSGPTT